MICSGLDRFDARKRLWADLEAAGLVIKTEPYTLRVPRSQRGGEVYSKGKKDILMSFNMYMNKYCFRSRPNHHFVIMIDC